MTDVRHMASAPQAKRFRLNPVELVIFSGMAVVLVNSVYHLFYDWDGVRPVAVQQAPDPRGDTGTQAGDRRVASVSAAPVVASLAVTCGSTAPIPTTADKVRLSGSLCGDSGKPAADAKTADGKPATSDFVRTEVTNLTNHVSATVFTDAATGKFSTDLFPVAAGTNHIELKFVRQGAPAVVEKLQILKADAH
jgi:hypothetical protein